MSIVEQIQQHVLELSPEKQQQVLEYVTHLERQPRKSVASVPRAERTKRIKKSLERLGQMQVFADITDPVQWQRNIRLDRPLPGRES